MRPCHLRRRTFDPASRTPVRRRLLPSHHGSLSAVRATLVKIVSCVNHVERVFVGLLVGAGHDAEIARLGIDRAKLTFVIEVQPRDIVAERPDLPARQ